MVRGCRNRVGPSLVSLFDGPQPAFAKDGTNPFTSKIVEIPHRGGHLARLSDGFDPAKDHFEMLALIFRACRAVRRSYVQQAFRPWASQQSRLSSQPRSPFPPPAGLRVVA